MVCSTRQRRHTLPRLAIEVPRMAKINYRNKFALVVFSAAAFSVLVWQFNSREEPTTQNGWTIGVISNNPNGLRNIDGFREGLQQLGFGEADGVRFLFAGTPVPHGELKQMISQMVEDGADLIFTAGTPTGVAAHAATRDSGVPVVFGVIADPVSAGVMADLSRPGGNMTGIMLSQNQARRLEILHSIVPDAEHILVPYNPNDPAPVSAAAQLEDAANLMGLTLIHAHARSDDEVTDLLAAISEKVEAVFMLPDSTVNRRIDDLLQVAAKRQIPVSGPSAAQVEAGATMAYGIVHREVGLQAARIAARIMRGANPADTPVETADYYLTVNIKAADRIGIDLPETVLQQADVIFREDQFDD